MKHAYTINETARELGIGRTKLYSEIRDGRISARKLGKKTIVLRTEIDRYLNALPALETAA